MASFLDYARVKRQRVKLLVPAAGYLACVNRPAYVYLLRCRDGSLYCGWTYDVDKRIEVHNKGTGARYTKPRRPVVLAAVFEQPDATAARREEARIKRLSREQKLALVEQVPPSREGSR